MKRPLTLVAFILSTVFLGIDLIFELISIPALIAVFGMLGEAGLASTVIVSAILGLAALILIIIALIINAINIAKWNKSAEVFAAKKGTGAIVLNFIIVALIIVTMILGAFGIISILLMIALIAANIMAIVDRNLEKKRVAEAAATEVSE